MIAQQKENDPCSEFHELMVDYLLLEIKNRDKIRLERHLLTCDKCVQILEGTREVLDTLVKSWKDDPNTNHTD